VKLFESLSIVAKPTSSNPAVITAIQAIESSPLPLRYPAHAKP
jgi:hypothetical protein